MTGLDPVDELTNRKTGKVYKGDTDMAKLNTKDAIRRVCGSKPRKIGRTDIEYGGVATNKCISQVLELVWVLDVQTITKGNTYVSFQYKCVILRVCSC